MGRRGRQRGVVVINTAASAGSFKQALGLGSPFLNREVGKAAPCQSMSSGEVKEVKEEVKQGSAYADGTKAALDGDAGQAGDGDADDGVEEEVEIKQFGRVPLRGGASSPRPGTPGDRDGASAAEGGGRGKEEGEGRAGDSDSDEDDDEARRERNPEVAGKQSEEDTAEKLVHTCKMALKRPDGPNADKIGEWEASIFMWDVWLDKFGDHWAKWRDEDEAAAVVIAREIRRKGKERGLIATQVNKEVDEAVKGLAMQWEPPVVSEVPTIEPTFSPELMLLRRMRVKAAERRLQQIVAAHSLKCKEEDEVAISKATLAAAKARILGKPHRHIEVLRLPMEDFTLLKSGTSLRNGVSAGTGKVTALLIPAGRCHWTA